LVLGVGTMNAMTSRKIAET